MGNCCKKKISRHQTDFKTNMLLKEKRIADKEEPKEVYTDDDFEKLKLLGSGSYGKVYLVKEKRTQLLLAMKVFQKKIIEQTQQEEHTKTEEKVLEGIKCPFIVKLFCSFQDSKKLYLVTEFMQGGELFYHLHQEHFFPLAKMKFYSCELICAIGYLHENNIIYRDLKPENILLGKDGHIKLADFGLSKILKDNSKKKAFTLCGTPEYLAPEMLQLNQGYDNTVDWWSLGILMYEMLSGNTPFEINKDEDSDIINYNKKLKFSKNFSSEAQDLIMQLLQIDPKNRIGFGVNGTQNIKSHPFFKDINWADVENKKLIPLFIPKIKNDFDTNNFDHQFTGEKVQTKDEDTVLNFDKKYKNFDGFSYTTESLLRPGFVKN